MKTGCVVGTGGFAAVFMLAGGLSTLGGVSRESIILGQGTHKDSFVRERDIRLSNSTELAILWEGRRAGRPYYIAGDALDTVGWLFIIPTVQSLATIFGGDTNSATKLFAACFVAPAIVSIVDFTVRAGTSSVTDRFSLFIVNHPKYDPNAPWIQALTPLQSLELTYRVARGRSFWLAALDDFFVTIGFITATFLAYTSHDVELNSCWKALTILNIPIAFAGCVTAIVRGSEFEPALLQPLSGIWFLTFSSLILPVWLIATSTVLKANDGRGAYRPGMGVARSMPRVDMGGSATELEMRGNAV